MTICFTIKASEIVVWSCFGAAIGRKKERKKKYFIKFIESWSQKFKFIQKSRKGENYSDCTWTRTQKRLVFKQTLETFGQFGQMVECSFMN